MTAVFRLLGSEEVPEAVRLLASAFAADPSMAHFLGPRPAAVPSRWDQQLGALLTLVLQSALRGGEEVVGLYLGSRLAAVAITEDRRPGLGRALRRGWAEVASLATVGRALPWAVLSRVEAYRRAVRQAHSGALAFYLVMLGVDSEFQRQGLGRQLFSFLVSRHPGVWGLDTENPANVDVYRRWGLTHDGSLRLGTLEVFLMTLEEKEAAQ
jgi:GNAT superfamily N-acetyltransferase